MGKTFDTYSALDLDLSKPNIELIRAIFIHTTTYSNFLFLDRFLFELSCKNTHRDSNEYSIVAFKRNYNYLINTLSSYILLHSKSQRDLACRELEATILSMTF